MHTALSLSDGKPDAQAQKYRGLQGGPEVPLSTGKRLFFSALKVYKCQDATASVANHILKKNKANIYRFRLLCRMGSYFVGIMFFSLFFFTSIAVCGGAALAMY